MVTAWIVDASGLAVDLDELVTSVERTSNGLQAFRQAHQGLQTQRSRFTATEVIPRTAYLAEILDHACLISTVLDDAWSTYVDHLRLTGMLYANAEQDATQLMRFDAITVGGQTSAFRLNQNLVSLFQGLHGAMSDTTKGRAEGTMLDLLVAGLAEADDKTVAELAASLTAAWQKIELALAGLASGFGASPGGAGLTGAITDDAANTIEWASSVIVRTPSGATYLAQPAPNGSASERTVDRVDAGDAFADVPSALHATLTETPLTLADNLARIGDLRSGSDVGQLEILRHDTMVDGQVQRSWSVIIRGTQKWLPLQANPQDMLTNLQEVGGEVSASRTAVLTAMELAGIRADEPVEIIGHSQGGIVAAAIAVDQAVLRTYNVRGVVTAGSPTGTISKNTKVKTLNVQNLADPVPALDGTVAAGANQTTVFFDGAEAAAELDHSVSAHSLELYVEAVNQLEDSETLAEVAEQRRTELGLTEDTVTVSLKYDSIRAR